MKKKTLEMLDSINDKEVIEYILQNTKAAAIIWGSGSKKYLVNLK